MITYKVAVVAPAIDGRKGSLLKEDWLLNSAFQKKAPAQLAGEGDVSQEEVNVRGVSQPQNRPFGPVSQRLRACMGGFNGAPCAFNVTEHAFNISNRATYGLDLFFDRYGLQQDNTLGSR